MISGLVYSLLIITLTALAGLPFTRNQRNLSQKLVFSYAIGFTLISVAGLAGNLLGVKLFALQAAVVLMSFIYLALTHRKHEITYDKDDVYAIVVALFYVLLCLFLLRNTLAWVGGDEVGHAATVREFLDGEKVPLSIYPFGSKVDYYPKAFHVYTAFWIKVLPGFGLLTALKTIPIIFSALSAFALYALVREFGSKEVALYSMVFFSMLSIHHFGYLIWAGYPSIAAEMLMLTLLLALVSHRWLIIPLIVSIALTHTRFLVYAAGVISVWVYVEAFLRNRQQMPYLLAGTGIAIVVGLLLNVLSLKPTGFSELPGFLMNQQYRLMWVPCLLALGGLFVSLKRRGKIDVLALSFVLSALFIALAADTKILKLPLSSDRDLNEAYIGLAVFSGVALEWFQKKLVWSKAFKAVLVILIIAGTVLMTLVFNRYTSTWSLPPEDFAAINWIGGQNYDKNKTIVVNMDSVGRWVQPLTGIKVIYLNIQERFDWYWVSWRWKVNQPDTLSIEKLNEESKVYANILFYSSSLNRRERSTDSPFRRHDEFYWGDVNVTNFTASGDFRLVYSRGGVFVFEFVPSA